MNILNFFLKLYSFLLILILLIGCNQPPQIPKVIDTIFLSPPAYSPDKITVNPQNGYVYIVNSSNNVSILQNTRLITNVSVGKQLHINQPLINTDTGLTYISNHTNTITILQETNVITTLTIAGKWPEDMAIEPHSGLIYIITAHELKPRSDGKPVIGGYITIIDATKVINSIYLGEVLAWKIKFDPINNYIYIGCIGGDLLVLKDKQVIKHYNFDSTIKSMAVNSNTGDVYIIHHAPGDNLLQFRKGELINSADARGKGGSLRQVEVHPHTSDVYILDYPRQEVVVVRNMKVRERIKVDWQPDKLRIDSLTGNVYVTGLGWGSITVIQNTQVISTISVDWYPYGIDVNPTNGWLYITTPPNDSVTILGFEE